MVRVKMELESIALYFNKKDLAADEIHTKINHVFGEGTVGYSIVTLLAQAKFCRFFYPPPQRTVKSRVLTQLTVLFCNRLTNSLFRHFMKLQKRS
jgi:hypothetical protein